MKAQYRFFGSYRFFLALVVVASHFFIFLPSSIYSIVQPYGIGNIAVMTFFVLSGYVIAEANDVFYQNKTRNFLINRFLRIIPPFLIALLVSVLIHYYLFSHDSQGLSYSIAIVGDYQNINSLIQNQMFSFENISANALGIIIWAGLEKIFGFSNEYVFVRYSWAVIVEFKFYFFAGLFYYLYRKYGGKVIYVFLLSLLLLFLYSSLYEFEKLKFFSFAPYFLLGIFMYYWLVKKEPLAKWGAIVSFILSVYHFYIYISKGNVAIGYIIATTLIYVLFIYTVYRLESFHFSLMAKKIDKFFGDLSYPIYINQYAVQIAFLTFFTVNKGFVYFIIPVISVIIVAIFLNLLAEPITKKMRDHFRGVKL